MLNKELSKVVLFSYNTMGGIVRVEIINDEELTIFINPFYFNNNITKNELVSKIKELMDIIDTRYRLNLSGFYKVKVYYNEKIGTYLNLIRIDDNELSNTADFRIVVYNNDRLFLGFDSIDNLDSKTIRYYNDYFYIDINDIDDINKYIDKCSSIIYGSDIKKVLDNSKIINL